MAFGEFLSKLESGLDAPSDNSPDESPASHVNVVLRAARRYLKSPSAERSIFLKEIEAFDIGLARAEVTLEELFEFIGGEDEIAILDGAHQDLGLLREFSESLREFAIDPKEAFLEELKSEIEDPVKRLLLLQARIHKEVSSKPCPYCSKIVAKDTPVCPHCQKRLAAPNLNKVSGEFVSVPAELSRLLALSHKVVDDKTVLLEWKSLLDKLCSDYRKSRVSLKPAIKAAQKLGGERLDLLHVMEEGITSMLDGFDRIGSFVPGGDPEIMNQGWIEMMEGYTELTVSGKKLAKVAGGTEH